MILAVGLEIVFDDDEGDTDDDEFSISVILRYRTIDIVAIFILHMNIAMELNMRKKFESPEALATLELVQPKCNLKTTAHTMII